MRFFLFSVFILITNGDYEFIPEPGLVYRVTGGVLDFYIFFGPDPESVIQQFTQV